MFQEKDFEDILSKYPELIEDGLTLKGRQVRLFGRIMDLLFEDRFKRKLIVELKRGPIKDDHIGQIMSYEGMLLSADDPTIRIMLIGNRVPPNIQRSLDHHGIAWREISYPRLREFLSDKGEQKFLYLLEDNGEIISKNNYQKMRDVEKVNLSHDELISLVKSSENYKNFKTIIKEKEDHEELARKILTDNLGSLEHSHLREIISLIDKPYQYLNNGKYPSGAWFGRLLQSNTPTLFESDIYRLNNWFNILTNGFFSLEKKFSLLLNEPNHIKGLNVGFITLMLYLLDKQNYCVWFEGLHEGYRKIYPETGRYSGKVEQYIGFNNSVKEFALKFGFSNTELDWVFSTGVYMDDKVGKEPSQKKLTILQVEYIEFFKIVCEKYKSSTGIIPGKLLPRPYLQIPVGMSGVHFEWTFHGRPRSAFGVELHFEGKRENNQNAIRYLRSKEEQIFNQTSESVIFQDVWGTKWSRIYIEKKEPILNHELADWGVDRMIRFQKVLDPLLNEYRANIKRAR